MPPKTKRGAPTGGGFDTEEQAADREIEQRFGAKHVEQHWDPDQQRGHQHGAGHPAAHRREYVTEGYGRLGVVAD